MNEVMGNSGECTIVFDGKQKLISQIFFNIQQAQRCERRSQAALVYRLIEGIINEGLINIFGHYPPIAY